MAGPPHTGPADDDRIPDDDGAVGSVQRALMTLAQCKDKSARCEEQHRRKNEESARRAEQVAQQSLDESRSRRECLTTVVGGNWIAVDHKVVHDPWEGDQHCPADVPPEPCAIKKQHIRAEHCNRYNRRRPDEICHREWKSDVLY